ncbi:proline-rich protein 36 [Gadus morhua]|uniref:proline-rich protein 36 n=1 Tax=Gadus morhua TaxID=8049 RepID=UPI0011B6C151|nr:leucine-rich repeat-containing protein 56 [Gadus morhua]
MSGCEEPPAQRLLGNGRGVRVTEMIARHDDPRVEVPLSPAMLRTVCGTEDLSQISCLEICVDTRENTLGNIGACLPGLVELRLNNSAMASVRDLGSTLAHLQVLRLSRCCLQDLDGVIPFTHLKELYLAYNSVSDLSQLSMLDQLQVLDVEGNDVDDLVQVQNLAFCSQLHTLSLQGNPVCVRPHPGASQGSEYSYRVAVRELVPQLRYLDDVRVEEEGPGSISSTMGEEWAVVRDAIRDRNSTQTAAQDAAPAEEEGGAWPQSRPSPRLPGCTRTMTSPLRRPMTSSNPVAMTSPLRSPMTSPSSRTMTSPSSRKMTSPLRSPMTSPSSRTMTSPSPVTMTSPLRSPMTSPSSRTMTSPISRPMTSPLRSPMTSPSSRTMTSPIFRTMTSPSSRTMTSPSSRTMTSPISRPTTSPFSRAMMSPSSRPMSSPCSSTSPRPVSSLGIRPFSAGSDPSEGGDAGASSLTHGAGNILFCGNPVQALRARRENLRVRAVDQSHSKHITTRNPTTMALTAPSSPCGPPGRLPLHVSEPPSDPGEPRPEGPGVGDRSDVLEDLRAWRRQHAKRLQLIEKDRQPEVLKVNHSDEDCDDDEEEDDDDDDLGVSNTDESSEECEADEEERRDKGRQPASPDSSFVSLSPDSPSVSLLPNSRPVSLCADSPMVSLSPDSASASLSPDQPQNEADRPRLLSPLTTPSPPPPPPRGPSPVAPATRRPSGLRTQRRRLLPVTGGTLEVSEDRRQQEQPLVGAGTPRRDPGQCATRAPEQGPLRPLTEPGPPTSRSGATRHQCKVMDISTVPPATARPPDGPDSTGGKTANAALQNQLQRYALKPSRGSPPLD